MNKNKITLDEIGKFVGTTEQNVSYKIKHETFTNTEIVEIAKHFSMSFIEMCDCLKIPYKSINKRKEEIKTNYKYLADKDEL
jgi:arsenate reductase-like glutaredoxin family protein